MTKMIDYLTIEYANINELKEMALNIDSVKAFIGNQEIKKIIPIKDKLVNIVI